MKLSNQKIKNIVIVGYPKSGTTWACRLVSELLQCHFKGNWGFEDLSLVEGENRKADYACFKSHHTYKALFSTWDLVPDKVIYLVRDPRDIVISGTYFFDSFFKKNSGLNRIKKVLLKTHIGKTLLQKRMTNAILFGDREINEWLTHSWLEHFLEYKEQSNIHVVKYENLLMDGVNTCKKILEYIDKDLSDIEIVQSINNQSFEVRKDLADKKEDEMNLKLLRSGKAGEWRKELRKRYVIKIEEEIGSFLKENNYS